MVRLCLFLFFLCCVHSYQQQTDLGDLASEIFGQQEEDVLDQQQEERLILANTAECEAMTICVICKGLHLFWIRPDWTPYSCHEKCSAYSFKQQTDLLQSGLPLCKIDDDEYDDDLKPFGCYGPLWFSIQGNEVLTDFSQCKKLDAVQDGFGIVSYESGDHLNREMYIGYLNHGVREGYGTLSWNDGSRYSGLFHNDMKQGEGTMFYSNGDIFIGEWKEEKKTGDSGTYMFAENTGKYTGSFSNGVQSGVGQYSTDGTSFSGQYLEGQREQGDLEQINGDTYSGFFGGEINTFSGAGTYIWKSCEKKYEGAFVNGAPNGQGILEVGDNISAYYKYEGEFKDGKFHGWGTFYWSPSNYFEGYFYEGQMTGVGKLNFFNGSFFDGLGEIPFGTVFHAADKSYLEPIKGIYSNLGVEEEAMFDGKVLKYKVQKVIKSAGIKKTVKKTGK